MKKKMTFALCFCNRGFMPGELIYGARDDMVKAVTDAGYDYIMTLGSKGHLFEQFSGEKMRKI